MTLAAPAGAEDPAFPDDAVEVGKVIGAWGIQGGIRIRAYAADPRALFSSKRWFIRPPETPGPKPVPAGTVYPPLLHITLSKIQGDDVVATAQELPDRNAAEAMRGARIYIARASFPTAADGEYYWIDLIGLAVVNREGESLGEVIDLLATGAQSVLRLRRPDANADTPQADAERLIPFVAAFIDDVNLAERRITVDWGLDY